jgi:hypothetical protein
MIITGYNPQGGITAYAMSIFSEQKGPDAWPPDAVAVEELNGQTITYEVMTLEWSKFIWFADYTAG